MKKAALLIFLLSIIPFTLLSAQEKKDDWRQRFMAEKIAFITSEVSLTPQEAETFWPVYNQFSEKREDALRKVGHSFHALEVAVGEGKQGKALSSLLNDYTEAVENSHKWEQEAADAFRKVLSEEKVAKLFIAEELFRRNQIKRLNRPHN